MTDPLSVSRLKPIVGVEAAECGLASLAMVANAFGHRCTLAEMRQRFSLSLKGASLNRLIGIAQQLGFQTRALRLGRSGRSGCPFGGGAR